MLSVSEGGSDLALLTWTGPGSCSATEQAAEAYAAIGAALTERSLVPVQERAFGDLQAAGCLAEGRARGLGGALAAWPVAPTYVEGSPVGRDGLAGIHVIAARGAARAIAEGDHVFGTVVEADAVRVLGLSDVGRRAGSRQWPGPAEEAAAAIEAASDLLARADFSFRDVARTWFFLRDILDWYGPFNAVRNAAFRRMGLMDAAGEGPIPASTGIEGRNARGGWCALDLLAMQPRPGRRLELRRLRNARQSEATRYGSAFARAVELTLGGARYVFVSGTASIDERGATVHVGDFEAQARFTLEAVETLLSGSGAGLCDVSQATVFLKNPCDARAFARVEEHSKLRCVPLVTTVADVCRPELLFEIDATAVVPVRAEGGR